MVEFLIHKFTFHALQLTKKEGKNYISNYSLL